MKCVKCGFSCDDETICPICGTPVAPVKGPDFPYRARHAAPQYTPPCPPPIQQFRQPPAPKEPLPPKPARKKTPDGLRIAFLCVLSVIAAALVYIAVIQTIGVCRESDRGEHKISYVSETKPSKDNSEDNSSPTDPTGEIKKPDNNTRS